MRASSLYEYAVRKARTNAKSKPVHMSGAVDDFPATWAAWSWKVVHKNAPGAISAIAFTVMPVRVRLRFISPGAATVSATWGPFVVTSTPPARPIAPGDDDETK